jgi:hypothetical protein
MPDQPEGPRITGFMRSLVRDYRAFGDAVAPILAKPALEWSQEESDAVRNAAMNRGAIMGMLTGAVIGAIDSYDAEQAKQSVA